VKPCRKCGGTERYESGDCKACACARGNTYYATHKEEVAVRNAFRKEEIAVYSAARYAANKGVRTAQCAAYSASHKEENTARKAALYAGRKGRGLCVECGEPARPDRVLCEEHAAKNAAAGRKHKKTNLNARLATNLRSRINMALKGNAKSGSAVRDLGCAIAELKAYLEAKFLPGMTWTNWSKTGWHIDHIRPLASFDLTDREQFLVACHYTNLQPLWAEDNMKKSDKWQPT